MDKSGALAVGPYWSSGSKNRHVPVLIMLQCNSRVLSHQVAVLDCASRLFLILGGSEQDSL